MVDYLSRMHEAKDELEKTEIYLMAEVNLSEKDLQTLVEASSSEEILALYEDKAVQEKYLSSIGLKIPHKEHTPLKGKSKSHKTTYDTTNEDW